MKNLFWLICLVVVVGLMQNTTLVNIAGVKPNLILVLLLFFIPLTANFYEYLVLLLVAGSVLNLGGSFNGNVVVLLVALVFAYLIHRRLLWAKYFNNLILIALSTALFYVLSSPSFIYENWDIVLREIIYNLILGSVLILLLFPSGHRQALGRAA